MVLRVGNSRKILGNAGEEAIVQRLIARGYTILARNYRRFYGEIDIIAQKDACVRFIEVKTRINSKIAPTCLITPSKQRKVSLTARAFITEHRLTSHTLQFDVALVTFLEESSVHSRTQAQSQGQVLSQKLPQLLTPSLTMEYIENAFFCYE